MKIFQQIGQVMKSLVAKALANKKKVLIAILVIITLFVGSVYIAIISFTPPKATDTGPSSVESDSFLRDENGNIKNVLLIDNEKYSLQMDLLGSWKEYLLPVDKRDEYNAFLVPEKNNENTPYFYIVIEEEAIISSESTIEAELIYSLRNKFDSFELEQLVKTEDNYTVSYKTTRGRDVTKNYQTIVHKDGYKISFVYSALEMNYAGQKGYIDDMIKSYNFEVKKRE